MCQPFSSITPEIYSLLYSKKDYKSEFDLLCSYMSQPVQFGNVLEAGAGTGTFTSLMKPYSQSITCIEPSPQMASYLLKRFSSEKIRVENTSIEDYLDVCDFDFDTFVAYFNVLNYIRPANLSKLITRLASYTSKPLHCLFDLWSLEYVMEQPKEGSTIIKFPSPGSLSNSPQITRFASSVFNNDDESLSILFTFNSGQEELFTETHIIYPTNLSKLKDNLKKLDPHCIIEPIACSQDSAAKNMYSFCRNWLVSFTISP